MFLFRGTTGDEIDAPTRAAWRATGAFAALALGQLLAIELWRRGHTLPGSAWFGAALIALAPAGLRSARVACPALFVAAVLLGAGHFSWRVLETHPDDLGAMLRCSPAPGTVIEVEGVVAEPPRDLEARGALADFVPIGGGAIFTLVADTVVTPEGPRPARGRVRVVVRSGAPDVRVGQRIGATGIAHAAAPPLNPGEADARLWRGAAAASLVVSSADLLRSAGPAPGIGARVQQTWLTARGRLRARASRVFDGLEGTPGGAMLAALLLGERETHGEDVRAAFARQGLAHVLAISGFHLAVMAGAALFAVRLTGDRGRLEPVLVAALVALYVAMLPVRAPILRAATLVLVWLVAEAFGRRYDRRALLAWIAIGVLLVRPMDLFGLGFQLTFGITGALVWFGERTRARLFPGPLSFQRREPPDPLEARWWRDRATGLLSASVLCWLVATPLVARSVGIVSPGAVVATVVVVPLVTLLLWLGYVAIASALIVPPVAAMAGAVLGVLAGLIVTMVTLADGIPLTTLYVPKLSIPLTAALTALVVWWLVRGRVRSGGAWLATCAVAAWLGVEIALAGRLPTPAALRVDTLAVGDGTCHLVRSGRHAMLWDCGSLGSGVGIRTIPRACRELGAWRVPEVVLTHPNFDHYSGVLDVAGPLGVRRVTVGESFAERTDRDPGGAAAALLWALVDRGIEVRVVGAGQSWSFGEARLEILSPPRGRRLGTDNDNSLVGMLATGTEGGERRVLFSGDIQREAIASLMGAGVDLDCEVLELPHHGSVHPVALEFVDRVDPSVVLQSTGPSRVLDIRWNAQRAGRAWFTTALDGAAWAEIRRDGSVRSGSIRGPAAE